MIRNSGLGRVNNKLQYTRADQAPRTKAKAFHLRAVSFATGGESESAGGKELLYH